MDNKREYAERLLAIIRDGAKLDSVINWLKYYAADQALEDALSADGGMRSDG